MSQREGHTTGGAIAPIRPAESPTPASGPGRGHPTLHSFDDVFAPLPTHQQLVPLDGRSDSLPPGKAPAPPGDAVRACLQQALANRLTPLALCEPVAVFDSALDETQRDAVARALQVSDLLLIQGPGGTGKTRLAIELMRQIAQRGGRTLFLSPEPAVLESALLQLAANLPVVRRLGPGESASQLSAEVVALTFASRSAALRNDLIGQSERSVADAETRLKRAESVCPLWDELTTLRERQSGAKAERNDLAARSGSIADEVRRVASSAGEPAPYFVQRLRSIDNAYARRTAQLDAAASELHTAQSAAEAGIRAAEAECQSLRPKADALQHGRWYTLTFWKAKSDGQLGDRLKQAENRLAEARATQEELAVREQKLAGDRRLADDEYAAERTRQLEAEATRRLSELEAQIAAIERTLAADSAREAELLALLQNAGADPAGSSASAGEELGQARNELNLCRERAAETQTRIEELVREKCSQVAVVAGPIASIAADSDVLALGQFELLIVDDAHRLAEADFLAAARLASRWILIGEPADVPLGRARSPRPDLFARLSAALGHDVWVRDGNHLICRLYPVRGADRRRLECEPVADAPEIEVRLFNPPSGEPTLAEVAFPDATPAAVAREYLFRELGEITCEPRHRSAHWQTSADGCLLRFGPPDDAAVFADIGAGVREELAGLETRAIHFNSNWTIESAKEWATEHIGRRDSGRIVGLGRPQRSCPGLARWLNRAFGTGFSVPAAEDKIAHVEFLAVPDIDPRRRREPQHRSGRVGGAGYEIDLADSRQRAALPADCADLPANGFVNMPEAQALVRYLEPLAGPGVVVSSPFPAQVMLLRRLLSRSSRLAKVRVLDATEAVRHECDLLVVSLTRSHVARAVPFGDSPAILANLLGRARKKVLFVGDPGTLSRRLQWEGPVDHLDAAEAAREWRWVAALADCPRVTPPRHR